MKIGRIIGRSTRVLIAAGLFFAVIAIVCWPSSTYAEGPGKKASKLSSRLQILAEPDSHLGYAMTGVRTLNVAPEGPGSLIRNEFAELLVYVRTSDITPATLDALNDAGATIVHVAEEYQTITAYIAPQDLTVVAELDAVQSVKEEIQPYVTQSSLVLGVRNPAMPNRTADGCIPAALSEGYAQLGVDEVRETFGLDGTGITVGVLSDSYDNYDYAAAGAPPATNATTNIATGNLPGPGNPCGHALDVHVIKEGPASSDEGRAMLQIVHDLAPGAELAFATAYGGIFDFADQIRNLRSVAGADVIVDDIQYFIEPYFQDGPIAQAIAEVTADGAVYVTFAGNEHYELNDKAIGSYETPAFRPAACPSDLRLYGKLHVPQLEGDCHDFNAGPEIDSMNTFTLEVGGILFVNLQWAEPWYGVETDLDFYLIDDEGQVLGSPATDDNLAIQIPQEQIYYENLTGAQQTVHLVVNRFAGTATPRLKYVLIQDTEGILGADLTQAEGEDILGPTIFGHSSSTHAITVGAIEYNVGHVPQNFSSHGFPIHYFQPITAGFAAAALPQPEIRLKPDIVATNGGCTTFFGWQNDPSDCYRFYGTSAAAPHAAAVAALMLQRAHQHGISLTHRQIESMLEQSAQPVPGGTEASVGAGLIDAVAAVNQVVALPNLALTHSASHASISPGDVLTYTLVVRNNGSAEATDVVIMSTLPPETTVVAVSDGTAQEAQTILWSIPTLAAGTSQTHTVEVSVNEGLLQGSILAAVSRASAAQAISVTAGVDVSVYVDALQVWVTSSADGQPVTPGTVVTYTATFVNYLPQQVTGVTLESILPAELQYVEGSSTITLGSIVYDFETGTQAWSVGAEDGTPPMNWELGIPVRIAPPYTGKCTVWCFGGGPDQDHTPGMGLAAWGTDLDDLYSNGIVTGVALYSPIFDFSAQTGIQLSYWEWLESENNHYDTVSLQYSLGAGEWTTVWSSAEEDTRIDHVWSQTVQDAAYADQQPLVQWRWLLVTDGESGQFGGWYLDDVSITYSGVDQPVEGGTPPSLVSAEHGYSLAPNQTLTVTFAIELAESLPAEVEQLVYTLQGSADGQTAVTVPLTLEVMRP